MVHPAAMAMASLTVMLWILWSDNVRRHRPSAILYAVRIALYIIVSGILTLNLIRYPNLFFGFSRALTILTIVVGIIGAGVFTRKMMRRV